jgi:CheY-like chemotaxis protein
MGTPVTTDAPRARILCLDDEPRVLEGIALSLRRRFDVLTATNCLDALQILRRERDVAVVLSDMRMPGMDGTAFLQRARDVAPDAVRVVLTGQADLSAAIGAVNDAHVFRFLTKPCPPVVLLPALEQAVEQHRLVASERVLLEQTLHGSIKALGDVLALTSPASFGRATRIARSVTAMAQALDVPDRWSVEVAAMVSQLGCITLPDDVVGRVHAGRPLSPAEAEQVANVPNVTERLLAHIPRLDGVRRILAASARPVRRLAMGADAKAHQLMRAAQMLRIATDYDDLLSRGESPDGALTTMRARDGYDPEVLEALAAMLVSCAGTHDVRLLAIGALQPGMLVADDVKMATGTLLVPRGYEVTAAFIERARNFPPGSVAEPIRVVIRREPDGGPAPDESR